MPKLEVILIIIVLTTIPLSINAETFRYIEDPLLGFQQISNIIITDTFIPPVFFSQGEIGLSCVAARYSVDILRHEENGTGSHVEGEDLTGSAVSLFGSYALSDTISFFGLVSGMGTSGDAEFTAVNGMAGYRGYFDVKKNSILTGMLGMAYEVLDPGSGGNISFPLYIMLKHQKNNTEMRFTDTNGEFFLIEDNDAYNNILIGCAVSFRIKGSFRITPYLLAGIWNETTPHVTRAVPSEDYDISIDEGTILHGVEFSYRSSVNFTISVSVDGLYSRINPVSEKILHGLEISSYSVSIGYFF